MARDPAARTRRAATSRQPREKGFTLRRAVPPDVGAWTRCLREAFAPFRAAYTAAAYRDTVLSGARARTRLRRMTVWLAVDPAGAVVGTLGWRRVSRRTGLLRGMAVTPAWQGTDVARSLLERAMTELARAGCERVVLGTTAPLERARSFYRRCGFRESGRTADFFGMPVTVFELRLGVARRSSTLGTPPRGRSGRRRRTSAHDGPLRSRRTAVARSRRGSGTGRRASRRPGGSGRNASRGGIVPPGGRAPARGASRGGGRSGARASAERSIAPAPAAPPGSGPSEPTRRTT